MVDTFLSHPTGDLCKVLVMDGEGCNMLVRKALHGSLTAKEKRNLASMKWFSKLEHMPLQGLESWPRMPIQAAKIDGQFVYAVPGVAHAQKNANGQLQSEIRVLFFGSYFADASGTLAHSMPLPAFLRSDPMSDRLSSLLNCPLYMIEDYDPDTCLYFNVFQCISFYFIFLSISSVLEHYMLFEVYLYMVVIFFWWFTILDQESPDGLSIQNVQVPWHMRGLLLYNLSCALCCVS